MRISRRIVQFTVLVAVALLVAAPRQREGSAKKIRKAQPGKSQQSELMKNASRLARPRIVDEGVNMLSLSQKVFDLSDQQKEELNEMANQRNEEARNLIKQLNKKYNDRAETALNPDQKEKYQVVNDALRDFRAKVLAAMEDLEKVGGENLAQWGRSGGRGDQLDISELLDLSEEQQKKMKQYREESRTAQQEARKTVNPPKDRQDKEAVQRYRQQMQQAYQKIQQDYQAKVQKLFTPEQQKKLEEVQQAMQDYATKVKKARQQYMQQLKKGLGAK